MGPHTAVIRALPSEWLTQGNVPVIPLWLALHSLAWGLILAIIIEFIWRRKPRRETHERLGKTR